MELIELIDVYKHQFKNKEHVYISRTNDYGFGRYSEIFEEILDLMEQSKERRVLDKIHLDAKDRIADPQQTEVLDSQTVQVEKPTIDTTNRIPSKDLRDDNLSVDEGPRVHSTLDKYTPVDNTNISSKELIHEDLKISSKEVTNEIENIPKEISNDCIDHEDPSQPQSEEMVQQSVEETPVIEPLQQSIKISKPQKGLKKRKKAPKAPKAKKLKTKNEITMEENPREVIRRPDQVEPTNTDFNIQLPALKDQETNNPTEITVPDDHEGNINSNELQEATRERVQETVNEESIDKDTNANHSEKITDDNSDHIIQVFSQMPQESNPDSPDISFIPPVNLSAIATSENQEMDLADISAFLEQDIEF
ncbi:hypothetical protein HK103_000173 [Boothiomyces macroporosus]|uniref:Uncharacterized protein n=1 Tax=Boothiomyces macroporosus TaxID=261099 RepID=A0AAD5YBI1_9FUNG|nr:hypothetical protein HK103_000173 [Boothiomyces macroporosus]